MKSYPNSIGLTFMVGEKVKVGKLEFEIQYFKVISKDNIMVGSNGWGEFNIDIIAKLDPKDNKPESGNK